MIAIKILNVKEFMNTLLRTDAFDHFLMSEGTITTYMTYILDGTINLQFFDSEEDEYALLSQEDFIPFSFVRPHCFQMIKGKHTPSSFKFILSLSNANKERTLASLSSHFTASDISGMYLNLKYQDNQMMCTTGISYRIFSMDKSVEQGWDDMALRFFKNHGILFEALS